MEGIGLVARDWHCEDGGTGLATGDWCCEEGGSRIAASEEGSIRLSACNRHCEEEGFRPTFCGLNFLMPGRRKKLVGW